MRADTAIYSSKLLRGLLCCLQQLVVHGHRRGKLGTCEFIDKQSLRAHRKAAVLLAIRLISDIINDGLNLAHFSPFSANAMAATRSHHESIDISPSHWRRHLVAEEQGDDNWKAFPL